MSDLYLAELVVYDPGLPGTKTLYYATQGFTTQPSETPANTFYDGRIAQAIAVRRDAFAPGTTMGRSQVSVGDLVLNNADGGLDGLLAYGTDGRAITIRRGQPGAAYPSGFTTIFAGTMGQIAEGDEKTLNIPLRDRMLSLLLPLQSTKYAGNNALPAGLEGVAGDLQGKPKPVCLGSVKNVSAPCVNTSKLIYQAHDGALQGIPAVYDKGLALAAALFMAFGSPTTPNTFASSVSGAAWGISPQVLPSGSAITCAVYGNGLIVIGANGNAFTSPDGNVWTSRTINAGFNIRGLAFDGTTFVAVGDTGAIYTSTDTITWTSRTSGFGTSNIRAVTCGNSLFVAVGDTGKISTSPTGTTWTAQTSGFGGTFLSATYGGGTYVAGGATGALYTSTNGTAWTSRTSGTTGSPSITALTYGNGFFILGSTTGQVCTSADATTWTKRASAFPSTDDILALGYGPGLYVAGGTDGLLATSPDGVAWQIVKTGFTAGASQINALLYASGLGVADYANTTDLQDDTKAPTPGSYKTYLAGGYFRLGSSPAGVVTADVLQGANAAARTAGQLFGVVLTRAGKSAGSSPDNYSSGDITTLDAALSAVCGDWYGPNDQNVTFADVLDKIGASAGAAWFMDLTGVYRIQQLLAPSGGPVASFVAADVKLNSFQRTKPNDPDQGVPRWRSVINYQRNFTVQTTDVAGGVTDAQRAFLAAEYRSQKADDSSVQTTHLLAPEIDEDTLLQASADASSEATRRQALFGAGRGMFDLILPFNDDTKALDLLNVISLTHSRFGFGAGKSVRILGMQPDETKREVALTIWGATL